MWHTSELQATEEELDLCYQDGVNLSANSNMVIGFALFQKWKG